MPVYSSSKYALSWSEKTDTEYICAQISLTLWAS